MPHCIIEYSQDLDKELGSMLMVDAAHQGALASGLFEESHIKSRALAYQYYKTGVNDLRFIHITAKILSGRTIEQKADLSRKILAQFEALIRDKGLSKVYITVEVYDLEREAYAKSVL
ncbi:MAG TPA: 5-carboxymethyl-2-hydroxymuconate Delta-isomerase [Leucothrix sp.]|nr:5-carboxymethyl-2-hydroxymuconate Delta-isomerase [Leucothrix sp.]